MTAEQLERQIQQINITFGLIVPAIPIVAATARGVIQLLKHFGKDTATFEEEVGRLDAAIARIQAADAAWRAEHPAP